MRKYIALIFTILFIGCGSFDDLNLNPDAPSKVTPNFLATQTILNATNRITGKWLLDDTWLMKSTSFTEHMEWYMYNKFDRSEPNGMGGFRHMQDLINCKKMVELAEQDATIPEGERKAYNALNLFMNAYFFYGLTMELGDIACSEALLGESDGIITPKYDTQEEVFSFIITSLEESSNIFKESTKLNGDFIFNGDVNKWHRTVNSFALRVLNMISKKDKVMNINIKEKFEMFASKDLIDSEENSFMRKFSQSTANQWYPFYYEKQNYWSYPVMTSFFIDMLTNLQDNRLFLYAEPAPSLSEFDSNSFEAYSGVDPTLEYGKIQAEYTSGQHSTINKRYHRVPDGEPIKFISYSEVQFILAEAALRGWSTGNNSKQHYENGIRAAMNFTYNHTPSSFNHNIVIDTDYINSYLNGSAKYNESIALEQIMTQKYIAAFVQLPFNSYFDYRRTGFPNIPINPETNMNEVKTQLPKRWMYPASEYSQNRENVEEAVKRQFNGKDTPNELMWILK